MLLPQAARVLAFCGRAGRGRHRVRRCRRQQVQAAARRPAVRSGLMAAPVPGPVGGRPRLARAGPRAVVAPVLELAPQLLSLPELAVRAVCILSRRLPGVVDSPCVGWRPGGKPPVPVSYGSGQAPTAEAAQAMRPHWQLEHDLRRRLLARVDIVISTPAGSCFLARRPSTLRRRRTGVYLPASSSSRSSRHEG